MSGHDSAKRTSPFSFTLLAYWLLYFTFDLRPSTLRFTYPYFTYTLCTSLKEKLKQVDDDRPQSPTNKLGRGLSQKNSKPETGIWNRF